MNKTFTVQAAALSLAAVVTLTLLSSVSGVANRQYDNAVIAQTTTDTIPTQQVVIVGKRISRA
ncbi:MAG TPA: hypothetical protein VLA16_05450 [Ideonella sp.]|nr:hypothetical protein [Ideonella sp.]